MPCSRTQHGLNRVGLEPQPLDPESEALTTRPPCSPVLGIEIHAVREKKTQQYSSISQSVFTFELQSVKTGLIDTHQNCLLHNSIGISTSSCENI